jgi:hypothetical protein
VAPSPVKVSFPLPPVKVSLASAPSKVMLAVTFELAVTTSARLPPPPWVSTKIAVIPVHSTWRASPPTEEQLPMGAIVGPGEVSWIR